MTLASTPQAASPHSQCARFPASFAQRRLWFLDRLVPNNPFYNVGTCLRISGKLDYETLSTALSQIVGRHETFRTTFAEVNGEPVQVVAPTGVIPLAIDDLSALPPDERETSRLAFTRNDVRQPFDLAAGPLIRARLLKLGEAEHDLMFSMHHIITDAWSVGVLCRDFAALYAAALRNEEPALAQLEIQYADYALWQRQKLSPEALEGELRYWRGELDGADSLNLPTDYTRQGTPTFEAGQLDFQLTDEVTAKMKTLGQQYRATPFMVLLAAFSALLYKYTAQRDVCVGTPIANRQRVELEQLVGIFVNTLPLRIRICSNETFSRLIEKVRQTARGGFAHQEVPFEKLVEDLHPQRDLSRNPLFQVVFAYQNMPQVAVESPGLRFGVPDVIMSSTRFDLECYMWPVRGGAGCAGRLMYPRELFDTSTIRLFVSNFQSFCSNLFAHPDTSLEDLDAFADLERDQLLAMCNGPAVELPPDGAVGVRIAQHARSRGGELAVADNTGSLTYDQLERSAQCVAAALIDRGVSAGSRVALCTMRSRDWISALLGVHKVGAAFVALDPLAPDHRLRALLKDSDACVIVVDDPERFAHLVPPGVAILDANRAVSAPQVKQFPAHSAGDHDPAYLIYTSGSTGTPNGVVVGHRALQNLCHWHQSVFRITAADRCSQIASYAFDATIWEIFPVLAAGASLHICPDELRQGQHLRDWLLRTGITVAFVPTPLVHQLLALEWPANTSLRYLLTGGDRLLRRPPQGLPFLLVNNYGPTENTVVSTSGVVNCFDSGHAPNIGKPISNVQAYVLDPDRQLLPPGVWGELCVGGASLAEGYWNRPELDSERFAIDNGMRQRLFRTGDMARWLESGELEFGGRRDGQVKIKGVRVELGEVESVLASHPEVRHAAVVSSGEGLDARLVAYVEAEALDTASAESVGGVVDNWRLLFEDLYSKEGSYSDPTFDISGWNSSYSKSSLPEHDMQEWVTATVKRIEALSPNAVLEIGCGAGLLAYRLAQNCSRYWATDISQAVCSRLAGELPRIAPRADIRLMNQAADDFSSIPDAAFDVVVLNSVIQYFPSLDYLSRVLRGAAKVLRPGGRIFVGDVRSYRHADMFYAEIALRRTEKEIAHLKLARSVSHLRWSERELLVVPEYFTRLRESIDRIKHVDVQLKRGMSQNEIVAYRYDVVLRLDHIPRLIEPVALRHWHRDSWEQPQLLRDLQESKPAVIVIDSVPNLRLWHGAEALRSGGGQPLLRPCDGADATCACRQSGAVNPEALCQVGEALGYRVQLTWSQEDPASFRAVFIASSVVQCDSDSQEPALLDCPAPRSAITPLSSNPGFAVAAAALTIRLRRFLVTRLPVAMQPATILVLEALPLSANGKLDRRLLPADDFSRPDAMARKIPPRTPIEAVIADIWKELLSIADPSVVDDFFDLGGHSLMATQLVSRLRERFDVEIPLRAVFEHPTIEGIATEVSSAQASNLSPIPLAPRNQHPPLSFAQQRLWFMARLLGNDPMYNVALRVDIEGDLNLDALKSALNEIIRRHEALRTSFPTIDGSPRQVIALEFELEISLIDLSDEGDLEELERVVKREPRKTFDLEKGPLIRSILIRQTNTKHVLCVTMHHIVCDGWSIGLFVSEFSQLYDMFALGRQTPMLQELKIQYADFSEWQRAYLTGDVLTAHLSYWKEKLEGVAELSLPTDLPRPLSRKFFAAEVRSHLNSDLSRRIHDFATSEQVTDFTVLLTAFKSLLYRYTGKTDICIGSPIANRNRKETESLIGFFVNCLILRTDLGEEPTFKEAVRRVRSVVLDAYMHQDLPFEKIVEELSPERNANRHPFFNVVFALQNAPVSNLHMAGLYANWGLVDTGHIRFDLEFHIWPVDDRLECVLVYDTELFLEETIRRIIEHFEILLREALAAPGQKILDIPMGVANGREFSREACEDFDFSILNPAR